MRNVVLAVVQVFSGSGGCMCVCGLKLQTLLAAMEPDALVAPLDEAPDEPEAVEPEAEEAAAAAAEAAAEVAAEKC